MKLSKKTGRKRKDFVNPKTGLPVVGLTRRPDGRWRVIGSHQTFREDDPQKAIERFEKIQGVKKFGTLPQSEIDFLTQADWEREDFPANALTRGFTFVGGVIGGMTAQQRFWRYVGQQIIAKPKWVAEMTGVEKIGYLTDLKPPQPLPSFDEIKNVWLKHGRCSELQRKKVARAWDDFVETAEIDGLRDITPQSVIAYQDEVYERIIDKKDGFQGTMSGKQQSHIFTGIRRMLTFGKSRGLAVDEIAKALTYLELLTPSEGVTNLDPRPIGRSDWDKLLSAAEGDVKAMLLLMLNGAFYAKEVIDLKWSDVNNGCIVTNRHKTGKCIRVCVLWAETIEALAAVKRHGEKIFYTYQGLPIKSCGAFRRFKELAIAAELCTTDGEGVKRPTVTPSQMRDGAYQAAAEAGCSPELCQLLVGHRQGMKDNYVKATPKMVKPACDAVYAKYFG